MILLGLQSVLCQGNPVVFCIDLKQEEIAFVAYLNKKKFDGISSYLEIWKGGSSIWWQTAQHLSAKVLTKILLCHVLHIRLNRWQIWNEYHSALQFDCDYCKWNEIFLDKIQSVVTNSIFHHLHWTRHNAICYHRVREAQAVGTIKVWCIMSIILRIYLHGQQCQVTWNIALFIISSIMIQHL